MCKKDPECDYYFSIDSDVALTNPDILRILMEENKYVEALFTPSVKPWAHLHWMRLSKTKKTTKKCHIFVDKLLKTDSQIFKCFRPTRVSLWRFSLWSGLLHGDWSRIDHFRFSFSWRLVHFCCFPPGLWWYLCPDYHSKVKFSFPKQLWHEPRAQATFCLNVHCRLYPKSRYYPKL